MRRPKCIAQQGCTCRHDWTEHTRGGGRCTGPSGYGTVPCQCPSFERDTHLICTNEIDCDHIEENR